MRTDEFPETVEVQQVDAFVFSHFIVTLLFYRKGTRVGESGALFAFLLVFRSDLCAYSLLPLRPSPMPSMADLLG